MRQVFIESYSFDKAYVRMSEWNVNPDVWYKVDELSRMPVVHSVSVCMRGVRNKVINESRHPE